MIYKGYDLNSFRNAIFKINDKQMPAGNWEVTTESLLQATAFFKNQSGFMPFVQLLSLVFHLGNSEKVANESVFLDNGKIVGKKSAGVLGDIGSFFGEIGSTFVGFASAIPLLGTIIEGIGLINGVVGLFSTPARTDSFNAKNELEKQANALSWQSYPSGSIQKHIRAKLHSQFKTLSLLRPKCRTGSDNCTLEHIRYKVRADITLACGNLILELVETYFNEHNFKEFIDNWQTISAQIQSQVPVEPSNFSEPSGQKSGCSLLLLPLIISIAGLSYFLYSLL